VLRSDAVGDPDRKRRFVIEAQAASALNHPNIVTIHEIDEAGGVDFLVMELVAGHPLDELIPAGGLAVDRCRPESCGSANAAAEAHWVRECARDAILTSRKDCIPEALLTRSPAR
jgi:serine/threonine-protein kinase